MKIKKKNDEKSPDGENENQQKTEKTSRATVMIIRLKSINRQNRMMPQNLKKLLADKVGEKRKFAKKYKRQTKPRR